MTEPSRILIGDTIEQMGTLPEKCVQCCVTSPPYWGLRDYGTARWEGGSVDCDHKDPKRGKSSTYKTTDDKRAEAASALFGTQYLGECKKCGAVRVDGQIGLESTPEEFVAKMVEVGRAVHRVLRDDGTFWLNIGDSYANDAKWGGASGAKNYTSATGGYSRSKKTTGMKPKDLCMMPWRVAMALQADGWWIRSVIVWAKKSPMPESCTDRPTSSWEPIFLMAKSAQYYYDLEAVREEAKPWNSGWMRAPKCGTDRIKGAGKAGVTEKQYDEIKGANMRNVWHLGPEPYKEAHFATFVTEIPRRAIKAGTSEKGCCPACGAPWTRIIDKTKITRERPNDFTKRDGAEGTGNSCANSVAGVSAKTIGWAPSCECAGIPASDLGVWAPLPHELEEAHRRIELARKVEVVPCLVLDPFLGSGTTVAVARELGRHGVGCELNPEYAKLARERIGKAERPETYRDDTKVTDAPLFVGGTRGH